MRRRGSRAPPRPWRRRAPSAWKTLKASRPPPRLSKPRPWASVAYDDGTNEEVGYWSNGRTIIPMAGRDVRSRTMRVAITADHNGVAVKDRLIAFLTARGHDVDDRARSVSKAVVDYPPLCEDVCRQVLEGAAAFAIVVGGSGSGEAIACNKIR